MYPLRKETVQALFRRGYFFENEIRLLEFYICCKNVIVLMSSV